MFKNNLSIAVKSNGKVLREVKDSVYVPFGTEYTILVKNLSSVRAQFRVSIDGTDATENVWLIAGPNESVELERFIKNGNLNKGNRFKFIERTEQIENHRGIKVDDGLIRIEYQFEKVARPPIHVPVVYEPAYWLNYPYYNSIGNGMSITPTADGILRCANMSSDFTCEPQSMDAAPDQSVNCYNASFNDAGITVPGSASNQQFSPGAWFPVETEKHVLVLHLLGETASGKPITQAVTVKKKVECVTCGKSNQVGANFCSDCGTALDII